MGGVLKVLLFLLVGRSLENSILLPESIEMEDELADCLLQIIRDSHWNFVVNIGIREQVESEIVRHNFMRTIEKFSISNDETAIDVNSEGQTAYNIYIRFYFVDSLKSLEHLIKSQREEDHDLSAERQNYLIILPANASKTNRLLTQIFDLCWEYFIVNVNVLVLDSDRIVTLYTYFPFTKKSCTDRTPIVHNRFVEGRFELKRSTFPPKVNNLRQCPVRIIVFDNPPYIEYTSSGQKLSGLESYIVDSLAEVMNFSLEVVVTKDVGIFYPNSSATGIFRILNNKQGDFKMLLCNEIYHENYAATNSFATFNLRILIKRPGAYSSLELLLFPFDDYTWITFLTILAAKSITTLLWQRIMNDSFSELHPHIVQIFWLFSILILESSYEGSIFNFLYNRPTREPPKNVEDAVYQGYKFVTSIPTYPFLWKIPELRDHMIAFGQAGSESLPYCDELKGKYGCLSWEEGILLYLSSKNPQDYVIIQDTILSAEDCTYFPKFSYLAAEFNRQLEHMKLHGHLVRIFRMGLSEVREKLRRSIISAGPQRITFDQLMGAFQFFAIAVSLSSCVFLVELLSTKSPRLRRSIEVIE